MELAATRLQRRAVIVSIVCAGLVAALSSHKLAQRFNASEQTQQSAIDVPRAPAASSSSLAAGPVLRPAGSTPHFERVSGAQFEALEQRYRATFSAADGLTYRPLDAEISAQQDE